MLYFLFATGQCNLECKYCGGSFPTNLVSKKPEYPIGQLKRFIANDPKPVIAFYGGEPLLNIAFIRKIMRNFSFSKFVIQSNGLLVKLLEPEYWLQFDTVLLSIDGRRWVTDYYRGVKVYENVIASANWLRLHGYKNDLVARMTVSELCDIFVDVKHLLSLDLFDHIHWQLDVVWSSVWKDFHKWCVSSYLPGIRSLVRLWLEEARNGKVLGLVPFIAILKKMISNESIDRPPCGAGITSIAVMTNGNVVACPIAVDVEWSKLGNISSKKSRDSMVNKVKINQPCTACDYVNYCGGRCLYAHYERLWGAEGFSGVCDVTIYTINELLKSKDEVISLIDNGTISLKSLDYPPFNNTTEIIP